MSHKLKTQDIFGIFTAIGITAVAVGIAFTGNVFSEDQTLKPSQNMEVIGIGGMTEIKESIKILFDNPTVDLDTSNGFLRANVVYEGFRPQNGLVFLEVYSTTGEKIRESEIQLRQRGNDVYEADLTQYFDKNEYQDNNSMLGQHILRISTEYGSLAKQAQFNVIMSSLEQPKQTIMVKSNIESGVGGILPQKTSLVGLDMKLMENELEDTIIKKYLSKVLKEYYNGEMSKDAVKKLTEFDDINCNFTNEKSQDVLNLSCEIKPNN